MEEIRYAAEAIGLSKEQQSALEGKLLDARKFTDQQKAICPECKTGKHPNCNGDAGITDDDKMIPCECVNQYHALRKLS